VETSGEKFTKQKQS